MSHVRLPIFLKTYFYFILKPSDMGAENWTLVPLQEQQAFLTAEPSLQSQPLIHLNYIKLKTKCIETSGNYCELLGIK